MKIMCNDVKVLLRCKNNRVARAKRVCQPVQNETISLVKCLCLLLLVSCQKFAGKSVLLQTIIINEYFFFLSSGSRPAETPSCRIEIQSPLNSVKW